MILCLGSLDKNAMSRGEVLKAYRSEEADLRIEFVIRRR